MEVEIDDLPLLKTGKLDREELKNVYKKARWCKLYAENISNRIEDIKEIESLKNKNCIKIENLFNKKNVDYYVKNSFETSNEIKFAEIGWLKLIEYAHKKVSNICSIHNCEFPAEVGAHCYLFNDKSREYENITFLVAMCKIHNNVSNTQPMKLAEDHMTIYFKKGKMTIHVYEDQIYAHKNIYEHSDLVIQPGTEAYRKWVEENEYKIRDNMASFNNKTGLRMILDYLYKCYE